MCQTPDQMLERNMFMPGFLSASNRLVFIISAIHASLPGQLQPGTAVAVSTALPFVPAILPMTL